MTATAAIRHWQRDHWLVTTPLMLLVAGELLRFLAYASVTAHPNVPGFTQAMCVWDCYWFGDIATHGYQPYPEVLNFGGPAGIANWAFFPLYPLLIAAVRKLVLATPATVGVIVSPLLTLAAALGSWPLFAGDRRPYLLFAALLLMGPFSFYFSILYSESLFLLLTVLAFVSLRRGNYVAAGLAGALLSATRTVGVLMVFAVLTQAWLDFRGQRLSELRRRPDMVLGLLLVPLGLFGFMAWLYLVAGDALAFLHIQRAWDREFVNPLIALWGALTSSGGQVRDARLLALASLAGLGLCGVLFYRRDTAAAVFCTLSLVLALTSGVESMLRFVAALAPLGIVLCQLLARRRWLFWLSLLVFAGIDFEFSIGWLQQQGALM